MMATPHLPPQAWFTAASTQRLLTLLCADGTDARFVGGCVRDALIDRPVTDVDLATPDPPDAVLAKLAAGDVRAIPTGIAHGTVTAVMAGRNFEITTLRRDVETDGRHAIVAFTDDWRADAARRDFTFNALSAGGDGIVHDYHGGIEDLLAGRVRFVGDPDARLAEDCLRLLRFYRFHAHFGRVAPAEAARAACRKAAPGLVRLSGERIRNEIMKLLASADPTPTLRMMIDDGILDAVLPQLRDVATLAALVAIEPRDERSELRRLASLVPAPVDPSNLDALADRLRLSNAALARLRAMAEMLSERDAPALRRALYRCGAETTRDRVLLDAARRRDESGLEAALALIASYPTLRLPVSGADVLARGGLPGPIVGQLLDGVEAWWIACDFAPDRAACLAELDRLMAKSRLGADS
mgnify:CR=1 FL=1